MNFVFDIDGTMAMPGSEPSEAVVTAMQRVRSRGHRLILSTGRTAFMVPPAVEAIGLDGYIYCAGGRTGTVCPHQEALPRGSGPWARWWSLKTFRPSLNFMPGRSPAPTKGGL